MGVITSLKHVRSMEGIDENPKLSNNFGAWELGTGNWELAQVEGRKIFVLLHQMGFGHVHCIYWLS